MEKKMEKWFQRNRGWFTNKLYDNDNRVLTDYEEESEWVSECCLKPMGNAYRYIMTRTSYIFDEMILMSALLDLVLVYWRNSSRVGIILHSNTLFLFWANQSLVFLLSDAWFAEKQNIPIK